MSNSIKEFKLEMKNSRTRENSQNKKFTACLVFADGNCIWGKGFGACGTAVAELCFNTSMTGYQEILTD